MIYTFLYVFIRVPIDQRLELLCDNSTRTTITAISLIGMTIVDITIFTFSNFCAKNLSYRFSFSIISLIMFIFIYFCNKKLTKK